MQRDRAATTVGDRRHVRFNGDVEDVRVLGPSQALGFFSGASGVDPRGRTPCRARENPWRANSRAVARRQCLSKAPVPTISSFIAVSPSGELLS